MLTIVAATAELQLVRISSRVANGIDVWMEWMVGGIGEMTIWGWRGIWWLHRVLQPGRVPGVPLHLVKHRPTFYLPAGLAGEWVKASEDNWWQLVATG